MMTREKVLIYKTNNIARAYDQREHVRKINVNTSNNYLDDTVLPHI